MDSLAVLILTRNEADNIGEAVQSVRDLADEIVLIDSGSTDRTCEIARGLGARISTRAWDGDFSAQRNFALTQTRCRHVLYLDADERVTPELAQSIRSALAESTPAQWEMERRSVAFGTTFRHGVLRPDRVVRLFPRESVAWTGKVHERPVCALPVKPLRGHLEHHTYRSWAQWEEKLCLYTTLWAQDAHKRGQRSSVGGAFAHAFGGFFKMFFLRLGFMDGKMGCSLSCLHFFYTFLKYMKLVEIQSK